MVDISIVDGGYKLTYNWGVPHCTFMVDFPHLCKSLQEARESTPFISIYHQSQSKFKTKQQLRGVRLAITSLLI